MVAAGLRIWHLNRRSLWFDEVVTLRLARASGPAEMFPLLCRIDGTRAPLHPLLLMGWLRLFGHSDLAARAFGAVLGVATVVVVYALGRRAFDEATALWGAWLAAVCPTLVYYSQEVRMYALLVLLTVLSWILFLEFRRGASWSLVTIYSGLLIALVYTHPLGLFMAAAHGLAYIVLGRRTVLSPGRWATAWCLTGLAVAPWIRRYLDHGTDHPMPRYPIRFLIGIPIEYIGGNSLTLIPWALLIAGGLLVWKAGKLGLRKPYEEGALLCWFAAPPLLMYTYSWIGQPIFGPSRYHLFVAPAYLLLVAAGLALLARPLRLAVAAVMLALTVQLLVGMTDAPARKADWRALAAWLNQRGEPARVVVYPHDPRFPHEHIEAARYYLEPAVEVQPEGSLEGSGSNRSQSPDGVVYHAHCFVEPSWKPADDEVISIRFHGLTITRTPRPEPDNVSPQRGDGP